MTLNSKSYSAGHFELLIDGHESTAYVKSVDGGWVRANVVDEPVGAHVDRVKHTSTVDIEPFSVEFGMAGAKDVLKWIKDSWNRSFNRRNGQITHANFDLVETFQHEFYEALIAETTFPALDGSSKEQSFLKVKLQPERVVTKKLAPDGDNSSTGARVQGTLGPKQKLWMSSAFRFNIDGLDEMRYTNKLESFTIKQGIKKLYTGIDRFPQIEPTKLEFPTLVGNIALQYADRILEWYQKYVVDGQNDLKAQKTGSIEFLSPDRQKVIFRINLYEMGIHHAQVLSSTANQDGIKRVKFELYVGRMELDDMSGMT